MQITATELKNNMGKYLSLAAKQDVYITKNGKAVAKLSCPNADKIALLDSLVGIIPDGALSLDEVKGQRLDRQ